MRFASAFLFVCFVARAFAQQPAANGSIVTTSTDLACTSAVRLVIVRADQNPVQLTLPAATVAGQEITIIIQTSGHAVTVIPQSPDAIVDHTGAMFMGGAACAAGESISLFSNGTGAWIVSAFSNANCDNWRANAPATAAARLPRGSNTGDVLSWDGTAWHAGASESVINAFSGSTNLVKPARAIWTILNGQGQTYASETLFDATVVTRTVTLKNFYAQVTPAPGVGESVILRVKKVAGGGNFPGTATTLAITITGNGVVGNDLVDRLDCAAGDMLYLEITGSTLCATKNATWGMEAVGR